MNPIDFTILCLTIWREARGESPEGRRAVLHVILNRVRDPRWPDTPYGVCLQPRQFSCHNAGDPNATLWPSPQNKDDWKVWADIQAQVAVPGSDPTHGAVNYHTIARPKGATQWPPSWADPSRETARIGSHVFYR